MDLLNFDGVLQAGNVEDVFSFALDRQSNVTINGTSTTSAETSDPALPGIPIPAYSVGFRIAWDSNSNNAIDAGEVIEEPSQLPSSIVPDPVTTFDGALDPGNYLIELTPVGTINSPITDSSFSVSYEINVSADTEINTGNTDIEDTNTEDITNIEQDFGTSLIETGNINDDNTSDIYTLSVVSGEVIDITLSGLTNDADLRILQDSNADGVVDDNEIYAISENVETNSENISLNEQGDYFIEVYQFEGSTDYTLQFDREVVTTDDNEPVIGQGDIVYRFFETSGQTQFYTTSEVERDSVIANLPNYEYEGESFIGAPNPGNNDVAGVTPVYRLFNTSTGVHLYTASEVERDFVVENLSNYVPEGISYYGYESQQDGTVPLYRFYNQNLDAHFYTPSIEERDEFIASPEYQPEGSESGIAFYVQPVEI